MSSFNSEKKLSLVWQNPLAPFPSVNIAFIIYVLYNIFSFNITHPCRGVAVVNYYYYFFIFSVIYRCLFIDETIYVTCRCLLPHGENRKHVISNIIIILQYQISRKRLPVIWLFYTQTYTHILVYNVHVFSDGVLNRKNVKSYQSS